MEAVKGRPEAAELVETSFGEVEELQVKAPEHVVSQTPVITGQAELMQMPEIQSEPEQQLPPLPCFVVVEVLVVVDVLPVAGVVVEEVVEDEPSQSPVLTLQVFPCCSQLIPKGVLVFSTH
jgi:hypothetical protein